MGRNPAILHGDNDIQRGKAVFIKSLPALMLVAREKGNAVITRQ
jgi:hypothetical protein